MASLRKRFESKVKRVGEHDVWVGATDRAGIGQVRVDGRLTTARRVAWELANGPLAVGARMIGCPDEVACVRLDHLSVVQERPASSRRARAPKGTGTKRQVRPGVWKLTVHVGRYDDGTVRRVNRTVHAATAAEAGRELGALVGEMRDSSPPNSRTLRDITVNDAIEQFLTRHLLEEKGREPRTVDDYRRLHVKWFAPVIGKRRVRDIDESAIDTVFGRMRRAGLSRSRMNQAKSLYRPFFRWAKTRHIIARNPMADFELPTSRHVGREHTPPEVDQLSVLLATAVDVVPDIAPVLVLGAVTGMRRGELVGLRRDGLDARANRLLINTAVSAGGQVKTTKTRIERKVSIDADTTAMLVRHCAEMNKRAAVGGVDLAPNAYVFSLTPDCSAPMPPDYVTKRMAVLKEHLGIAEKRPSTIALEDEALRLYRQRPAPRGGKPGPPPQGGLSYEEIGTRLERTGKWAARAVESALRREAAEGSSDQPAFDGSILALRKFTSSELLDAGFNISAVAQRQGHGPQVLVKHYAKSRESADRKAAEHLGRIVHQGR